MLRTYKLGEADRIVVLLTAEHGKVRAVAKGVRKTKSRFGGRLEPLSHVSLLLYQGRELDVVSQADTLDHFRPLHDDLDRLTRGIALLEAVDQLAQEREPNPQLYQMLLGALRTLAHGDGPLLVGAFYWKLLAAEGVQPELDACVELRHARAARRLRPRPGWRALPPVPPGVPISPAAIDLLRRVFGGDLVAVLAEPVSPATHEVDVLAVAAMEHHIERRLRAVTVLGQV